MNKNISSSSRSTSTNPPPSHSNENPISSPHLSLATSTTAPSHTSGTSTSSSPSPSTSSSSTIPSQITPEQLQLIRTTFREIRDYPRPGNITYALEDVLASPPTFQAIMQIFHQRYQPFIHHPITHIVASECRGFLLGAPLALLLQIPFIPVRRSQKLPYDDIISTKIRSQTYFSTGNTLEMQKGILHSTLQPYTNTNHHVHPTVLIIDDVIGSGATVEAIAHLVKENGGTIFEVCAIAHLPNQHGKELLTSLQLPYYTILP